MRGSRNGNKAIMGLGTLAAIIDHRAARSTVLSGRACDMAERLLAEGDFGEALNMVLPVIVKGDDGIVERARKIAALALEALADQSHDQGDAEGELGYLEQWLAIQPNALYPQIRRAEILWLEMENGQKAYRAYREAAEKHPCSIEAWLGLAQIDLAQNHLHKAVRHLKRAWGCLKNAEWGYPPTAGVVMNVLETLYVLTARVYAAFDEKDLAEQVLLQGIQILDEPSLYISDYLKDLRANQ